MKTLLTATALTALLATAPVMAQDAAPTNDPATGTMNAPAANSEPMDSNTAAPTTTPDTDMSTPGGSAATETAPSTDMDTAAEPAPATGMDTAAASTETFIAEQQPGEIIASELMGTNIYNSQDEGIGAVTDVVATEEGQIKALVVGVGGFLGIGTKDVAVNYDEFTVVTDGDANQRVVLNRSKEELESAPEFRTLADIAAEQPMSATGTDAPTGSVGAPATAPQ
jgi:Uncharacterized conserved protein